MRLLERNNARDPFIVTRFTFECILRISAVRGRALSTTQSKAMVTSGNSFKNLISCLLSMLFERKIVTRSAGKGRKTIYRDVMAIEDRSILKVN